MTQQEWQVFFTGDETQAEEALQLLGRAGFQDCRGSYRILRRIAFDSCRSEAFAAFFPHLWVALSEAAGPDRVVGSLERFLFSSENSVSTCQFLAEHPRLVEILVKIFSSSQFLTDILLRNPEYFEDLIHLKRFSRARNVENLAANARAAIHASQSTADQFDMLRRFQRRELLRIGVCDLLDLYDLTAATRQLSDLADCLVQTCLEVVRGPQSKSSGFAVIGMGKLGGQELNYSSDVDFLFISASPSPEFTRIGEKLIDAIARVTTEGFLYRVDMRLRPWGKVGPLVSSPDGFISYLSKHALQWEKQALLKARVIAGDRTLGEEFLRRARPLIQGESVDSMRADVYAMKQRMEDYLQQKGRKWGDVKLGEGSIRDVEFCVQFLQMAYGADNPDLYCPNTLEALAKLANAGLVTPDERRTLSDGYIFLRTIEHHLQMMDYRQTHILPEDPEAITSLARRLGFRKGETFMARYRQHSAAIRQVYLTYVGNADMKTNQHPHPSVDPGDIQPDVRQHRARMSPSYAETFTDVEISRHAVLAALLEPKRLAAVDGRLLPGGDWRVSVVAYDFPGELSLICGLMVVYGMDIVKGDVFTYEPAQETTVQGRERKIVDVFTVRPVRGAPPGPDTWLRYEKDLESLLEMVRAGQRREARGELAKRVANSLYGNGNHAAEIARAEGDLPADLLPDEVTASERKARLESAPLLTPVEIEFDHVSSDQYTVLHIQAPDTTGFLYEITNALAIYRIYIARVTVDSVGSRVRDTLFVTDENGAKITDAEKQRELRAAIVLIKHFTHLLPFSPNPESALLHFREFIAQLFKRPNWTAELSSLERPEVLHALARLLGVSDFLWDDFLRMQYANLYPVVRDVEALDTVKTRQQLQEELEEILRAVHPEPRPLVENAPWYEALNDFKDREMFRIDMRHILGQTQEFWDFAAELSDLAEVVVNAAFHLCHEDLRAQYGTPLLENGKPSEMAVCALGKCGGRELGFASDIELMFIYSGNGQTSGPQVISSTEFYEKLVTAFVRAIRARREGIFEIDLQLRPYGKAGSLSVSLDSFRRYFAPEGAAWAYERQALVKLRPVAGDESLGQRVSEMRDAFVYTGEPFDVTSMRAMRERQVRHLVTGGTFNLKYSPGGLVDVEYLVQGLQITHGKEHAELRQPNTREAMSMLEKYGLISASDHSRMRKAHTFLRWMIDSLRVVRGNARDITVPREDSEEFSYLGRRMPYGSDPSRLLDALSRYTRDVLELNSRLLG